MLRINWIFMYCLPEIQAAGRRRLLESSRFWIIFNPFPSKKWNFASSRIWIRNPIFLPLFITTFLCLQQTAWGSALFASPPRMRRALGVGRVWYCNCSMQLPPFCHCCFDPGHSSSISAHPPPRSLFSISQTRCSRGLDPRGYEMDGIQTGV